MIFAEISKSKLDLKRIQPKSPTPSFLLKDESTLGERSIAHHCCIQLTKFPPPQKKNKANQITPSIVTIAEKPHQCSLWFGVLLFLPSHASQRALLPTWEVGVMSISCSSAFIFGAKLKQMQNSFSLASWGSPILIW